MTKVALDPRESHIGISIERLVSTRDRPGVWSAKIFFSINNLTSESIRIININAEKHYASTSNSSALTVGLRDGVDLTVADSLIESGRYYDIRPRHEQSLVGTLAVQRWIRIPANLADGDYILIFTISFDYYCVHNRRRCRFKVTAPDVFYFHFDKNTTPIEGEFLHFNEGTLKSLREANARNKGAKVIVDQIESILESARDSACIVSGPEELQWKVEEKRRAANLGIIAKMRASADTETHRVLFLAADPTDAASLRLGEELREIQEKLQLSQLRARFKVEQRMSVRPADLSQALLDVRPTIVHFSGHGTATGGLCFENKVGQSHLIEPGAIAALFEQFADQVRCVLLNACYSEIQARAIARHVGYVIGMSEGVGDKAAISFAVGFYQALGGGRTIEDAYKLGCVQIRLGRVNTI